MLRLQKYNCIHLQNLERVIFKVLLFKRLAVHVYSNQGCIGPCVQEADWQALSYSHTNSYTLLWDGSQMFLLFLPSSCHLEVSVLHSHRLFVCVLSIYCPMFRDLVRKCKHCLKIWNSARKFSNLPIKGICILVRRLLYISSCITS